MVLTAWRLLVAVGFVGLVFAVDGSVALLRPGHAPAAVALEFLGAALLCGRKLPNVRTKNSTRQKKNTRESVDFKTCARIKKFNFLEFEYKYEN